MFCPHCGSEIPDDSAFCGICGKTVEPEKRSGSNGVLKIILCLALVIAIAGGAVFGIFKSGILQRGRKSGAPNYCVYISDDSYSFIKDYKKKDVKPIKITSLKNDLSEYVEELTSLKQLTLLSVTNDGKYAYFFNRLEMAEWADSDLPFGTLYQVELGKLRENSNENDQYILKIDSDVIPIALVRDDNSVIYVKKDSDKTYNDVDAFGKIYYFDGKESAVLAKGVLDFHIAGDYLYYIKSKDYGETCSLYYQTIGKADSEVKIASDVDEGVLYCIGEDKVAYAKPVFIDGINHPSLYIGGVSIEPKKLCDNFCDRSYMYSFEDDSEYQMNGYDCIANKAFFFMTETSVKVNLADYVNNPYAASDAGMVEPDSSDSKYQKTVQKTDWWGDPYTTTETDYDAYEADYVKYSEAQERILLMNNLADYSCTDHSYSLYFYDVAVGEPVLVADHIDARRTDPEFAFSHSTAGAVYLKKSDKVEQISIDTVMSESNSSSNYYSAASFVEDYYFDHAVDKETIYCTVVGGEEKELDAEKLDFDGEGNLFVAIYNGGKNIAIMSKDYDEHASDVFEASVSDKKIGDFTSISAKDAVRIYSKNDKLMYVNGSDVYLYQNGEHICLLRDCGSSYSDNIRWYKDGTGLVIDDYDANYGGTLFSINDKGKSTRIADDVVLYQALDDGTIMYLSDESLKLYDGKNSRTIAQSVETFWTLHEKEVAPDTTYYYNK